MDLSKQIDKIKNNILSVVIIIIAFMVAKNIYLKQAGQLQEVTKERDMRRSQNQVLDSLSMLEKKVIYCRNNFAKKDASSIVNNISGLARESGIKIVSIKPEPEQRYSDYTKLPFSLVINASSYHALGRFVSNVEGYKDVYIIENIDIREAKTDNKADKVTAVLTISSVAFLG